MPGDGFALSDPGWLAQQEVLVDRGSAPGAEGPMCKQDDPDNMWVRAGRDLSAPRFRNRERPGTILDLDLELYLLSLFLRMMG